MVYFKRVNSSSIFKKENSSSCNFAKMSLSLLLRVNHSLLCVTLRSWGLVSFWVIFQLPLMTEYSWPGLSLSPQRGTVLAHGQQTPVALKRPPTRQDFIKHSDIEETMFVCLFVDIINIMCTPWVRLGRYENEDAQRLPLRNLRHLGGNKYTEITAIQSSK